MLHSCGHQQAETARNSVASTNSSADWAHDGRMRRTDWSILIACLSSGLKWTPRSRSGVRTSQERCSAVNGCAKRTVTAIPAPGGGGSSLLAHVHDCSKASAAMRGLLQSIVVPPGTLLCGQLWSEG